MLNLLKGLHLTYIISMDPNKKEREAEEAMRREVKASKKQWRAIRKERFGFLDTNSAGGSTSVVSSVNASDEKKMNEE